MKQEWKNSGTKNVIPEHWAHIRVTRVTRKRNKLGRRNGFQVVWEIHDNKPAARKVFTMVTLSDIWRGKWMLNICIG